MSSPDTVALKNARPVPQHSAATGGYNNDLVVHSVPESQDELVVIPQFWNHHAGKFMYSTEYPWQLQGLLPPQCTRSAAAVTERTVAACDTHSALASLVVYTQAIRSINDSIKSKSQKRMNVLLFCCGGCCAMCCSAGRFSALQRSYAALTAHTNRAVHRPIHDSQRDCIRTARAQLAWSPHREGAAQQDVPTPQRSQATRTVAGGGAGEYASTAMPRTALA